MASMTKSVKVVVLTVPGRGSTRLARAGDWQAQQLAEWEPTSRWDLQQAVDDGRLFDPLSVAGRPARTKQSRWT